MARVGIYSGTFDPVHAGHIGFAEAALQGCKLDRVVFLPEREPRGKYDVGDFGQRVHKLREATSGNAWLDVMILDEARFTIEDTLPFLREQFVGDRLALLVGSDVAKGLHAWPGLARLVNAMEIIIGLRAGSERNDIEAEVGRLAGVRYSIVESPFAAVSSSQIRNRQKGRL